LDEGIDPRTIEVPEIMAQMNKDLPDALPLKREDIAFPRPEVDLDFSGSMVALAEIEQVIGLKVKVSATKTSSSRHWAHLLLPPGFQTTFEAELQDNHWSHVWLEAKNGKSNFWGFGKTPLDSLRDFVKKIENRTLLRDSVFSGFNYDSRIVKLGEVYLDRVSERINIIL
jgi:isopentenyl diphosphate isomerase/L-lactate dehydrogenase-like FMN-dependent dehydrogenase